MTDIEGWPTVLVMEPLLCSQGGIPYNKIHLDARDAEIRRLRAQLAAAPSPPAPTSVSEEEMVMVAMDAALEFQNNAPARATISKARHSDVRGLVRSAVSAILALLGGRK